MGLREKEQATTKATAGPSTRAARIAQDDTVWAGAGRADDGKIDRNGEDNGGGSAYSIKEKVLP